MIVSNAFDRSRKTDNVTSLVVLSFASAISFNSWSIRWIVECFCRKPY